MTIDRQGKDRRIVFHCDDKGCHEAFDTDTNDFQMARALLKDEGWLTLRNDDIGEWEHICGDCQ